MTAVAGRCSRRRVPKVVFHVAREKHTFQKKRNNLFAGVNFKLLLDGKEWNWGYQMKEDCVSERYVLR